MAKEYEGKGASLILFFEVRYTSTTLVVLAVFVSSLIFLRLIIHNHFLHLLYFFFLLNEPLGKN